MSFFSSQKFTTRGVVSCKGCDNTSSTGKIPTTTESMLLYGNTGNSEGVINNGYVTSCASELFPPYVTVSLAK